MCMHTHIHIYNNTYTQTCIHTYIQTHIHAYKHTHTHMPNVSDIIPHPVIVQGKFKSAPRLKLNFTGIFETKFEIYLLVEVILVLW